MMKSRPLSLPAHGVIEFLAGIVMMLVPLALSFSVAALIPPVAMGAILTGVAVVLLQAALGFTTRYVTAE